jgi:hypothetical protein
LKKDYRSTIIIGLLFFMTGLAIVLYLNQYAPQPRERDYAYAGSFYAFAIWIGLGIIQIVQWLQKKTGKRQLAIILVWWLIGCILVPGYNGPAGMG